MIDNKQIIKTIHFGEIEVSQNNIIRFNDGLLGFEDLSEYVIISEEESEPFKWLISIQQPAIGFPLLDPWLVIPKYNPGRSHNPEIEAIFGIVTLGNLERNMSINLKAPVIINIEVNEGRQVILPTDKYSPTHIINN